MVNLRVYSEKSLVYYVWIHRQFLPALPITMYDLCTSFNINIKNPMESNGVFEDIIFYFLQL